MNSLLGSKIWYSVAICIDSVQNRPNSVWQTEYHHYLISTIPKFEFSTASLNFQLLNGPTITRLVPSN